MKQTIRRVFPSLVFSTIFCTNYCFHLSKHFPPRVLHFPVNAMVGGDNSLRADISPEAPSSFLLYMRTATHLDLWVLSYLCVQNNQFTGRRKYCSFVIFAVSELLLLGIALKKDAVCLASKDPHSFLSKNPDSVIMSMTPK